MVEQNNLRHARKKQHISLMELSAITGISTATLVGVERYNLYPGPSVRERLSKALGRSEATLWPSLPEIVETKGNGK